MTSGEELIRRAPVKAGIVAAALAVAAFSPAARAPFAVALALFLPGWAVARLMMKPERPTLASTLLAVGLSLSITVFGGVLLHHLGLLTPFGWMAFLGGVTLAALAAGGRGRLPTARSGGIRSPLPAMSRAQAAMFVGALALAATAYLIARAWDLEHREFPATEFWLVSRRAGAPNAVTLGARNLEPDTALYDVELRVDGQLAGAWRAITLAPGQSWTTNVDLGFKAVPGRRAEAWLFKNESHVVYRRVWIDVGRL